MKRIYRCEHSSPIFLIDQTSIWKSFCISYKTRYKECSGMCLTLSQLLLWLTNTWGVGCDVYTPCLCICVCVGGILQIHQTWNIKGPVVSATLILDVVWFINRTFFFCLIHRVGKEDYISEYSLPRKIMWFILKEENRIMSRELRFTHKEQNHLKGILSSLYTYCLTPFGLL